MKYFQSSSSISQLLFKEYLKTSSGHENLASTLPKSVRNTGTVVTYMTPDVLCEVVLKFYPKTF